MHGWKMYGFHLKHLNSLKGVVYVWKHLLLGVPAYFQGLLLLVSGRATVCSHMLANAHEGVGEPTHIKYQFCRTFFFHFVLLAV